jgi:hypothetical protein
LGPPGIFVQFSFGLSRFHRVLRDDFGVVRAEGPKLEQGGFAGIDGCGCSAADEFPSGRKAEGAVGAVADNADNDVSAEEMAGGAEGDVARERKAFAAEGLEIQGDVGGVGKRFLKKDKALDLGVGVDDYLVESRLVGDGEAEGFGVASGEVERTADGLRGERRARV